MNAKMTSFLKTLAKIHLVCQIGLGKPLWARVFRACCCNSDYCERYCDVTGIIIVPMFTVATVITASGIVTVYQSRHNCLICCNSDYCERYKKETRRNDFS